MSRSTTRSLAAPSTYVSRPVAGEYLRQIIITTLQRHGFDSAEAGALAEIERLLEARQLFRPALLIPNPKRYVRNTFTSASRHAAHAHRSTPAGADILAAQSETSWPARGLRKTAKKRRRAIRLDVEVEAAEPTLSETLESLKDFMRDAKGADGLPDSDDRTAEYAYEGAPSLPGRWTYTDPEQTASEPSADPVRPPSITPASLEFVKSIVTEKDLDPELGIVHFRRSDKFGGGKTGKRKWSTRGVGMA